MQKKFKLNRAKIKDGCQSGRKVVAHDSKSDLPLVTRNRRIALTKITILRNDDNFSKLFSLHSAQSTKHINTTRNFHSTIS